MTAQSQPPYMTIILHVRGTYIYILPPYTGTQYIFLLNCFIYNQKLL